MDVCGAACDNWHAKVTYEVVLLIRQMYFSCTFVFRESDWLRGVVMLSSRVYLWLAHVLIVCNVYVPQQLSLSFSLGECEVSPGSDVPLSMIRAGVWTHCVSDQKISLPALQIWQLTEGKSRVLLAWIYCLVRVFGMRCESKTVVPAMFAVAI